MNRYIITPNAIGTLMVQMDDDDDGQITTAEVVAYINGQGENNFFGHINNVAPNAQVTEAEINHYNVGGNGIFNAVELQSMFQAFMMHLAIQQHPNNAMDAFNFLTQMIDIFNNNLDGNAMNVDVPPPPPAYEVCGICLDDIDDNRPARKCRVCHAWFHVEHIAGIGLYNICGRPMQDQRICPNCRAPWELNCAGQITRNGPVLVGAQQGGNRSSGNKRKSHTRKSHTRKSHTRKSHTRKSHTRKSHKRKAHKRKATR